MSYDEVTCDKQYQAVGYICSVRYTARDNSQPGEVQTATWGRVAI